MLRCRIPFACEQGEHGLWRGWLRFCGRGRSCPTACEWCLETYLWLARNGGMNPYSSPYITHYSSFHFLFHSFILFQKAASIEEDDRPCQIPHMSQVSQARLTMGPPGNWTLPESWPGRLPVLKDLHGRA